MTQTLETAPATAAPKSHPLWRLTVSRMREDFRERDTIFWLYCFPILMVIVLGGVFQQRPQQIIVDVAAGPNAEKLAETLNSRETFIAEIHDEPSYLQRLRTGKSTLVVKAGEGTDAEYEYVFDPTRPESASARNSVDDVLQRAAGRKDSVAVRDTRFDEPGGRYVDFLVPGLLAIQIMGGGFWGVGFVAVDYRRRKLLKCFLGTPMRKRDFLGALVFSRLLFLATQVLVLVWLAWLMFGVTIVGSVWAVGFLTLLGSLAFSGIALVVASRARSTETVYGLSYLVMLPMWLFSGIFVSTSLFPEAAQTLVQLLPLTPLVDSLRAVMQEGATLASQWLQVVMLLAWTVVSCAAAVRWFRWI
jgi:ABC-type multidrug transport system permease subunit